MDSPIEQIEKAIASGKIGGSWLVTGGQIYEQKKFIQSVCSLLMGDTVDVVEAFHPDVKWIECGLTEEAKKEVQKNILAGKAVEDMSDLSRKREITVEDIRAGIQFLSLKSAPDKSRILIINPADKMNENAANALLKALEEPAEGSIIFLLCQNTGKLLPTIKSRCRKIKLKPLSEPEMIQEIQKLYPALEDAPTVARLADGSMGLARDICENDGLALYRQMTDLFVPTDRLSAEAVKSFAGILNDNPIAYDLVKKFLMDWLVDQVKQYAVSSPFLAEDYLDLYQEIHQLFIDVDRIYLDKKQVLQTVFFKIAGVLS
ncbi:MAG: hypothetical protein IJV07_01610 [Alphaproteobacteria bacterium]|nr:hypothetical protein [Alphaproteobacteria bacterium]